MGSPSFLQLQTQAGHGLRTGSNPRSSSDDSLRSLSSSCSSSSTTASSPSPKPSLDIVRCSRCQRSLSLDLTAAHTPGAVRFGTNSYYCNRCATAVGFVK